MIKTLHIMHLIEPNISRIWLVHLVHLGFIDFIIQPFKQISEYENKSSKFY